MGIEESPYFCIGILAIKINRPRTMPENRRVRKMLKNSVFEGSRLLKGAYYRMFMQNHGIFIR
jgi:hypothetical protein